MSYSMVKVVMADESDGRLWPVLADPASTEVMLVQREDLDGTSVITVPVTSVSTYEITAGGNKKLLHYKNIKAWLYVTDSRAIFACEKWDKGNTYFGFGDIAAPIAVAATAVSRVRARSRNRGKILTGQVRYQWLNAVRAAPRTGPLYPERLRLLCSTRDDKDGWCPYMLELMLPGRTEDALDLALEIIHRAAAFKLRWYDEISAEPRAELGKLAVAPPLQSPEKGKASGHSLPYYLPVRRSTAHPAKYVQQAQQP
jgi:hypothetical protein